jgi:hypothetical protein
MASNFLYNRMASITRLAQSKNRLDENTRVACRSRWAATTDVTLLWGETSAAGVGDDRTGESVGDSIHCPGSTSCAEGTGLESSALIRVPSLTNGGSLSATSRCTLRTESNLYIFSHHTSTPPTHVTPGTYACTQLIHTNTVCQYARVSSLIVLPMLLGVLKEPLKAAMLWQGNIAKKSPQKMFFRE